MNFSFTHRIKKLSNIAPGKASMPLKRVVPFLIPTVTPTPTFTLTPTIAPTPTPTPTLAVWIDAEVWYDNLVWSDNFGFLNSAN